MAMPLRDPVRHLEHSHARLTKLTFDVREMILSGPKHARFGAAAPTRLVALLEALRDELLEHFANEEEGLFPFLRRHVPDQADAVDRLEQAHDVVCGTLARLAHAAARDPAAPGEGAPTLIDHFERFEAAYSAHSREEIALFDELGRRLDGELRAELADALRGL
jgi:iron-sulfur cluster repair protein YtfE (RIC family)